MSNWRIALASEADQALLIAMKERRENSEDEAVFYKLRDLYRARFAEKALGEPTLAQVYTIIDWWMEDEDTSMGNMTLEQIDKFIETESEELPDSEDTQYYDKQLAKEQ